MAKKVIIRFGYPNVVFGKAYITGDLYIAYQAGLIAGSYIYMEDKYPMGAWELDLTNINSTEELDEIIATAEALRKLKYPT